MISLIIALSCHKDTHADTDTASSFTWPFFFIKIHFQTLTSFYPKHRQVSYYRPPVRCSPTPIGSVTTDRQWGAVPHPSGQLLQTASEVQSHTHWVSYYRPPVRCSPTPIGSVTTDCQWGAVPHPSGQLLQTASEVQSDTHRVSYYRPPVRCSPTPIRSHSYKILRL